MRRGLDGVFEKKFRKHGYCGVEASLVVKASASISLLETQHRNAVVFPELKS